MRLRLRLLLTSFNKTASDYALARLEVALANQGAPAPPVVDRVGPVRRVQDDLAQRWPSSLMQVGAAADFVAAVERNAYPVKRDLSWARLARTVRLLAQFAESIEWLGIEPGAGAAPEDRG